MNVLDMLVIGVVVLSALLAFARGFVREALSIVSWLGATAAALYLSRYIQPYVGRYVSPGKIAEGVAAGIVFILALIVLSIVASRVSKVVQSSSLSALDRTLGLVFGLGRGALLACIGFIGLTLVLPPGSDRPRWMTDSKTLPLIASATDELMRLVPGSLRQKAQQFNPHPTVESEVESAIRAYTVPTPRQGNGAAPAYSAEDQQRLNQLFQQLQSNPDAQRAFNQYLQSHPDAQDKLDSMMQQTRP